MQPQTNYPNDTRGTIDARSIISHECLTPGQMTADLLPGQARDMTQQAFSYGQAEYQQAMRSLPERPGK